MNQEIIKINNLSKSFGNNKVLEQINLNVERGQSIALLGVNGSGKSTLLRMICGLTTLSAGEIKYNKNIKFNYIPEHFPKMNITARQYIKHMGLIEKLSKQTVMNKCQELAQAFYMENMMDISMKNLSKGTLQKVAVIQAMLTKPDVLLLDEPLSGQDMKSQKKFIELINELKQQGVTIIMSCHEMFLVNQISDIAYEIKNAKLERVIITRDKEYEILIFESKNKRLEMKEKIKEKVERSEISQQEIKLVVQKDNSNEIIIQMLQDGFELRRMKGMEE